MSFSSEHNFDEILTGELLVRQRMVLDCQINLLQTQGLSNIDIFGILKEQFRDYFRLQAIYIIKFTPPLTPLLEVHENVFAELEKSQEDAATIAMEEEIVDLSRHPLPTLTPAEAIPIVDLSRHPLPTLTPEEIEWLLNDSDLFVN